MRIFITAISDSAGFVIMKDAKSDFITMNFSINVLWMIIRGLGGGTVTTAVSFVGTPMLWGPEFKRVKKEERGKEGKKI